jgi:DDE_Tnp_1-associated/Transposase DDE domain
MTPLAGPGRLAPFGADRSAASAAPCLLMPAFTQGDGALLDDNDLSDLPQVLTAGTQSPFTEVKMILTRNLEPAWAAPCGPGPQASPRCRHVIAWSAVEAGARDVALGPGVWQRLEALPDPRSPQGRIYPLACLIAIAVCAFTAAGNDRFTAVGQWIKRADQADLARLHAPWDPLTARYRAPDEKTIRVVLDRLDPGALARALLGPRPRRARPGGPASAHVRAYRARRAAQQAKALARDRLRAVAVDGKTSRGARRADGTGVHLLGAAEHGGRLLDHLEVDVKHNETSHFTELLQPLDLVGAVVTFDALHTVRANLGWLATEKKAHYIAVVKKNQPLLYARVKALPWRQIPSGSITRGTGHGRIETRTLKTAHVSRLDFPHAARPSRSPAGGRTPPPAKPPARPSTPSPASPAPTPPRKTWPASSASTGRSRCTTTSGT